MSDSPFATTADPKATPPWRPRYWIPGYDRWSLIAPGLCVIVVAVLFVLPKRAVEPVRAYRTVPLPPLAATTIVTPLAGSIFRAGQVGDLAGAAQPGSMVRLYYGTNVIAQVPVPADGRYRFRISNFPPGQHTLRAQAVVGARSQWSDEVTFTVQAAPKAPTATKKPAPAKKKGR
ncbi:MAG TPA: hypothetical protein VMB21_07350 [Candidatus Limnocylindria bacterium]|jgi:hypothetical protein|nr:hypothetical protein [Candidatus Limnocylindria bacterium]